FQKVQKMYAINQCAFNETTKPKTMTLKWHEAHYLELVCRYSLETIPNTEKAHNDLLMLANQINQKLI
ncbi:MAG: hypothetical protein RIS64_1521, partial [Bacteroidota bacterium]